MKQTVLIILTIFAMIVCSGLTAIMIKSDGLDKATGFIAYNLGEKNRLIKTEEFDALIQISNSSGWNLETKNLNFGKIRPGEVSARFITLKNDLDEEIIIKIEAAGQIKAWFVYPKEIHLNKNSSKEIEISATAPDLPAGNYSGKVMIKYFKI